MKYIKKFENLQNIKVGNLYKHYHTDDWGRVYQPKYIDENLKVSISKLVEIIDAGRGWTKFAFFKGFCISPEEYRGEEVVFVNPLSELDEYSIPTEDEVKEYELLKNMYNYNL